jgi:hypothetical protein
MITAGRLYDAVQLAEASYALFDQIPLPADGTALADGTLIDTLRNKDLEGRFAPDQAQALVASWSLISHQPDTSTGFSATLFQHKSNSSDYVLALRGTEFTRGLEELNRDLIQADLGGVILDGVAANQIVDLHNYWQSLSGRRIRMGQYVWQGRVLQVNADATEAPSPNTRSDALTGRDRPMGPLAFRAIVELASQELAADGVRYPLQPGMQVASEIHLGTRTVLEYLLSPVQKAFHEAARER